MVYFTNKRQKISTSRYKIRSKPLRKAVTNEVRKILSKDQELKHITAEGLIPGIDTVGQLYQFPVPTQGVGEDNISGTEWIVKSIKFKGYFEHVDSYNTLRVIAFIWHDNNSPTGVGSVLEYNSVAPDVVANINYQAEKAGDFTLLTDRTLIASSASQPLIIFDFNRSWVGKKQASDVSSGTTVPKFYMAFLSDSTATPHVNLYYTTEVFFTDP